MRIKFRFSYTDSHGWLDAAADAGALSWMRISIVDNRADDPYICLQRRATVSSLIDVHKLAMQP